MERLAQADGTISYQTLRPRVTLFIDILPRNSVNVSTLIGRIPVRPIHSFAEIKAPSIPSVSGLPGVDEQKSLKANIYVFQLIMQDHGAESSLFGNGRFLAGFGQYYCPLSRNALSEITGERQRVATCCRPISVGQGDGRDHQQDG